MIPATQAAIKPTTTGHAKVNGISMYYETYGSATGIPLVLLHGGGSTIQTSFENIIPFLVAGNKVIAIELQAHGRTTDRDAPETFEQDADDVAGLLQQLKITKANIMGFSNGGTTTLQIAIRHPEVVHKMVVISGAYQRAGFAPGFFDFMPKATIDNMPAPLKATFLAVTPDKARLQAMFEKDKARVIAFPDISDEQIRGIKSPGLFMVADKDVVSVEHTHKMSQLVEGSSLVVLPGTHGGFIGEVCVYTKGSTSPQATALLVNDFLHH